MGSLEIHEDTLLLKKGLHHARKGDVPLALSFFEEALQHNPKSSIIYHHIARAWESLNEFNYANTAYLKALKYNPENCELMEQVNRFRLTYFYHIPQDRKRILLCSQSSTPPPSLQYLKSTADVFMANDLHLSLYQYNWPIIQSYLPEGWIPDWILVAPLENNILPTRLQSAPCPVIGLLHETHPHMHSLAYSIPPMDALIVQANTHKKLCRSFTNKPIFLMPLSPFVNSQPQSTDTTVETWSSRPTDILCGLPRQTTAHFRHILSTLHTFKSRWNIRFLPTKHPEFAKALCSSKLYIHCPETSTNTSIPSLFYQALQTKTPVMTPENIDAIWRSYQYSPCLTYNLNTLETHIEELLSDPKRITRIQNKASHLLNTQWSLPALAQQLILFLDQKSDSIPKTPPIKEDWIQYHSNTLLSQMNAISHHWPAPLSTLKFLHEQALRLANNAPYNLAAQNNLAVTLGFLTLKCPSKKDTYRKQFLDSIEKILQHDPYHPQALFNKVIILEQLSSYYDIPSLIKLEEALYLRNGEHYFFEDSFLSVTPWGSQLSQSHYSALREHKWLMSNEDFIVAYRNILIHAVQQRLGAYSLQRHDYKKSITHFKKALKAFPEDVNTWIQLAQIALKQKDPEDAYRFASRALDYDPLNTTAMLIKESISDSQEDLEILSSLLQTIS
jgi:tetratricopeptide (TPR) repeat protein